MGTRIFFCDKRTSIKLLVANEGVAQSRQAIVLKEQGYQPVFYIPITDVAAGYLKPSQQSSHCPYKGQANYWHILVKDLLLENAAWEYKSPYSEVKRISDHLAFYLLKIDEIYINDIKISSHRDGNNLELAIQQATRK